MHKSKLISALRTLGNQELKWFEAYIHSPFFNKNEKAIQLFMTLKKHHPEYEEKKVSMEAVFPKLFPGEKFEEQRLRYVMTDLTKLVEGYLTYIEFEQNEIYRNHLLLNAYDRRGLDKYFLGTLEDSYAIQKKQPYRDVTFFFNQHLLEENAYLHSLSRKPRAISSSLQEAVDNLDLYYLSNRMRYSCAILNREELLQEKYNNLFLDEILAFLEKTNLEQVPSISIYHKMVMNYVEPENLEHYNRLKALLETYSGQFRQEEVKDMYTHVLNYCIRKLNGGDLSFLNEIAELHKTLIAKGLIFEDGYISPNTFKNIVTIALRTDQLPWIEEFIHSYKERIQPEYRESTFTYSLANLHYYRREFSKALKLMQTVEMSDIYYHLDAKVLLLKTYYELDETEPFFSLVDAFTNYLKRNKLISDTQRTVYLNFVRYARKLMQLRLGSRITPAEVSEELHKVQGIANLQWLNEKLAEIERSAD